MKRIIKNGKVFRQTCKNKLCECQFEFDCTDAMKDTSATAHANGSVSITVICPACGWENEYTKIMPVTEDESK